MEVRLRIAGLYFNRKLVVPAPADGTATTIKTVLDFCKGKHPIGEKNGFSYTTFTVPTASGSPIELMQSMMHNYSGSFDFNGDGKITAAQDNKGLTLGANSRDGGLYALKSQSISDTPDIRLVWQYYVRANNGDGISRSKTLPKDSGFKSFADFEVKEGDEILWRLVTIQFTPIETDEKLIQREAMHLMRA
jgi:hypothetical protein